MATKKPTPDSNVWQWPRKARVAMSIVVNVEENLARERSRFSDIRSYNQFTQDPADLLADALDEAVDDLLLATLSHAEVDGGRARLDAELGGVGDVAVHRCGLEERLGGDAATVEAGPPEGVFLDDRHPHARRCGIERGAVATGASTDDDEIELIGRRNHLRNDGPRARPAVNGTDRAGTLSPRPPKCRFARRARTSGMSCHRPVRRRRRTPRVSRR